MYCTAVGARLPGVWFYPGATTMDSEISSYTSSTDYFTQPTSALPIGSWVDVTVSVIGSSLSISASPGINQQSVTISSSRMAWPNVYVYASDPWYPSANAQVKNLLITSGPTTAPTLAPTKAPVSATPTYAAGSPTPAPVPITSAPSTLVPTQVPTLVTSFCPQYSAVNSANSTVAGNYVLCGIQACPGQTFTVGDCSLGNTAGPGCSGDQFLRLYDSTGSNNLMTNNNFCGLCSQLTYTVPSSVPCQTFELRQGCLNNGACTGIMTVVGALLGDVPTQAPSPKPSAMPTVSPTALPSVAPSSMPTMSPSSLPTFLPSSLPTKIPTPEPSSTPTVQPSPFPSVRPSPNPSAVPTMTPSASPTLIHTNCPAYSTSATNFASVNYVTCGFTACSGVTITIGNCNANYTKGGSTCVGNQVIRLFDSNLNLILLNDDSCGLCSAVSFTTYLPCQTYSIHQGCFGNGACSGVMQVVGAALAPTAAYVQPTVSPTLSPTASPTLVPTYVAGSPTPLPTSQPTMNPTAAPTRAPTYTPGR